MKDKIIKDINNCEVGESRDSSQSINAFAISNSPMVNINNINISLEDKSIKRNSSLPPLPTIQEVLRKDSIINGEFFRKDVCWVDFYQGYIIERKEVNEVIQKLETTKVQLILGKPASGKSIILKNIGYNVGQKIDTYFFSLKIYYKDELATLFAYVTDNSIPSIYIIDDAHLYPEECIKLIRKFREVGKGNLILVHHNKSLLSK